MLFDHQLDNLYLENESSHLTPSPDLRSSRQTMFTLPPEIQLQIFGYLPQSDLRGVSSTNKKFHDISAEHLYKAPHFASTFRYAQFAHVVAHDPQYAKLVQKLDLSYFQEQHIDRNGERIPTAGWREFKYRYKLGYSFDDNVKGTRPGENSTHPAPNQQLRTYSLNRDIPIGGLCHVLAACKNIKELDLSGLQISSDFLGVTSPTDSPPVVSAITQKPATSGLHYISDDPNITPWTPPKYLQPVYLEDVLSFICQLDYLKILRARRVSWLNINRAGKLLGQDGPKSLEMVDLQGSGIDGESSWTMNGTREEALTAFLKECILAMKGTSREEALITFLKEYEKIGQGSGIESESFNYRYLTLLGQ